MKPCIFTFFLCIFLVTGCFDWEPKEPLGQDELSEVYLDNFNISVGVSLEGGGMISSLEHEGKQMVNSYDFSRGIQIKLRDELSGGPGHEEDWDPAQGGMDRNGSGVLDWSMSSNLIYTKTRPYHFSGGRADAHFTQRVSFVDDEVIQVDLLIYYYDEYSRFGSHEWPAMYLRKEYKYLIFYNGKEPFFWDSLKIINLDDMDENIPRQRPAPTENWAALVDEKGIGITIYSRESYDVLTYANFDDSSDEAKHIAMRKQRNLDPGDYVIFKYYIIPGHFERAREIVYDMEGY